MLKIENKRYIFKTKQIWFCDSPVDVKNCSSVDFRACKNDINVNGFDKQQFTTLVIDLTQDLDTIWKNISKSTCRLINRAKKDGVNIHINKNYEEFYKLNGQFRTNKGIMSSSIDIDFMKKYGTLFTSEFEGEILSGSLYLEDEDNIRGLIGASKRLEGDKQKARLIGDANRLIKWETIKYAKNKGIKEYDMGGYYTGSIKDEQKERINNFKKGFGGELVTHYIYQKDYSKKFSLAKHVYQLIKKA